MSVAVAGCRCCSLVAVDEILCTKEIKMLSRTNLKQQLMREQMQQLEKKEKETSVPTYTSSSITVPLYSSPTLTQLPKQILMVKSKLVNPTHYHIKQSQQRQLREFISESDDSESATNVSRSQPPPLPPVVNSLDPSPSSDFSIAFSAGASPAEYEQFWQDFGTLHAVTDSIADSGLDPSLKINASEADVFGVLSMINPSCPSVLTDVTEEVECLSDDKVQAFEKDRQKKDNHNRIERKRRFNINDRIQELGRLLPGSHDLHYDLVKDIRQNKGSILKASVDYVKCLKRDAEKVPMLQKQVDVGEKLNRKLLLRIQALELELKNHDIPVSQSNWYLSSKADINAIIKQERSSNLPQTCAVTADQSRLPFLTDHSSAKTLPAMKDAPVNATRSGQPFVQFLTVKNDLVQVTSPAYHKSPSPGLGYMNPPVFTQLEDLIMDDDHLVTCDPLLSSSDSYSQERMDFTS